MKSRSLTLAILAALGLADATYLSYERLTGGSLVCPVTGSGCDTVQTSWYAAPYGVPIAYFGLFGYLLMLILALLIYKNISLGKFNLVAAFKLCAIGAASVSVVLTGVQAFVIEAFCFWCLISATLNLVMLAVLFAPISRVRTTTKPQARRQKGRKAQQRSHSGLVIALALSLVMVLVGGLTLASRSSATPRAVPTNLSVPNVALTYPLKGETNAPVTVVVYSDYQCPACASFALEVEPEFDRLYVATGKVKVEFRELPLSQHANAVKAAMAARIAGDQGQYWKMHDLLFLNQAEWEGVSNPDSLFTRYASQIGLDMNAFALALKNNTYRDVVEASGIAAMQAGVQSTPTVLVNGQKSSWTTISVAVDKALAASSPTR